MHNRRKFLRKSLFAGLSIPFLSNIFQSSEDNSGTEESIQNSEDKNLAIANFPVVLSTWEHGLPANKAAWEMLKSGGSALDAVEAGIKIPEADPNVNSVGYGSFPDREGHLTLDACIMDENGNCGSVMFMEGYIHPISVARRVMEKTPHIHLAGEGAEAFAKAQGFESANLLTKNMKEEWKEWKAKQKAMPTGKANHDTIGLLAIDKNGNISGGCSTSGLAFKMHGRVGDSPIIGAGMYCDNEVGGACATGKGEAVIKIAGSFLIVELMRNGKSPQQAVEIAMDRLMKANKDYRDIQIGFLALNKKGEVGAYGLAKGFQYALSANEEHKLIDAPFALK